MDVKIKPINIFYSYASEDKPLRDELERHLGALRRSGIIIEWHNRDIQAGSEWEDEIDAHLNTSQIILLLVSSDFIHTNYCYSVEMQKALERHRLKEARVIPILLRSVDWEGTPIAPLQMLPSTGEPIIGGSLNRDAAFADVAKGIRSVIKELTVSSSLTSSALREKSEQTDEVNSSQASNKDFVQEKSHTLKTELESLILSYPTINTYNAVALFHHLMQPDSTKRIFRLIGDGKMGKTHLVTKVFPTLAQSDYQTRYASLDLRNTLYGIPEILKMACDSIGIEKCQGYNMAYQTWFSRSHSPLRLTGKGIRTFFSFFRLSREERFEDPYYINIDLMHQFMKDIEKLDDKLLLLLFDSVSNAKEDIQHWLTDIFLVHLSHLKHVRVVIAGRSLLEVNGGYTEICVNYHLKPIVDIHEYIAYCQKAELTLKEEQSIRDIAKGCDYTPGTFVDFVIPKFLKPDMMYG